jgi:23S rRNA (adenine2030-N6)-methyltransferase
MLSYRHGFHAGLHADVFKHLVLTLLVRSLLNKDKPFFYLDTHAGAGRYNLGSEMAQKNREFETGIGRLWSEHEAPEAVDAYLAAVRKFNPADRLQVYPGSPRIVRELFRSRDRMVLCDLHSNDFRLLCAEFAGDRQVRVEKLDGYQALKALLPPIERRGLVLIDPAFELKNEWRNLLDGIQEAYRRWATGIFAIWYPIQDRMASDEFLRRLGRTDIRKILVAELSILDSGGALALTGSGMLVINPPWQLEEQLRKLLPWLWGKLSANRQGTYRVDWLVGE